ncbi:MAG: hypothetical protein K2O13_11775, partial [Lachnospiraceae bacterium]|nr:hypothetical protein [Lachnospiraceae bacterium]
MQEAFDWMEQDIGEIMITEEKKEVIIDDGRIESIEEFQTPETLYEELINRVRKYHPSDDISLIEKAYRTAND